VNVYTVDGGTTKRGKGTPTKPIPTGLGFDFRVEETDDTRRATVIETYAIGAEGLRTNPKLFPKCAFSDLDDASVPARCNNALVGTGIVKNAAGPSTDTRLSSSTGCNLRLRLFNDGDGMTLRLDGDPPAVPVDSDQFGCALPIHTAINGKFVKRKIAGIRSSDLVFSVPQNLKHPLTGTDNSVRRADTDVRLKARMVRGKKRGFYEKVGCKGGKRTIRATFKTEQTASSPAQTFTATKVGRC
jgi:hypothetical protein